MEYGTDVPKKILEICHRWEPDLIVLGTRGRTGLKKIWMGSVAEEVFRSSSCPVLTIGPAVPWPKTEIRPNRILFPTDFSPESVRALNGCVAFAEAKGSTMVLLHVATMPHGEAAGDKSRIVTSIESRLRSLLPPTFVKATTIRVEFGEVPETISSVAEEDQCSLIVMGLHAEKGLLQGRWEHAYQVVSQATCPVLTVRTVAR